MGKPANKKPTYGPSVFVVDGQGQVIRLFYNYANFNITTDADKADIVVFTGGADVSPFLYGERAIDGTHVNIRRDMAEVRLFKSLPRSVPKIGICRGAQFLNVMGGGSLYQDVDNHTQTHKAVDTRTHKEIDVTSTHHQMMRPPEHAKVIATASQSTYRETEDTIYSLKSDLENEPFMNDPEVVWFEDENLLCFQPHPEYGLQPCRDYFFDLVQEFIVPRAG